MKWQPFVPKARANAQIVINEESGAAVNIILTAGIRTEKDVRRGEVFATHPGHHEYEMRHFLFSHVVVRELEYDEETPSWHFEIMADIRRENFISARFIRIEDSNMLVKLKAVNNSVSPATWNIAFFASPNEFCTNAKIHDRKIETDAGQIAFAFDAEWYNTPPITARTKLDGMLLEWGITPQDNRQYMNYFCEWELKPGETAERLAVIGNIDGNHIPGSMAVPSLRHQAINIQPDDEMNQMIKHLENQIRLNRAFPPAVKYSGNAFAVFTPAASWDDEYFWDAGFIAAGLTVFNPEKAEECIRQYMPLSANTVFPNFHGARVLVQVTAAWELYQQTGNKETLKSLYEGLHELFNP